MVKILRIKPFYEKYFWIIITILAFTVNCDNPSSPSEGLPYINNWPQLSFCSPIFPLLENPSGFAIRLLDYPRQGTNPNDSNHVYIHSSVGDMELVTVFLWQQNIYTVIKAIPVHYGGLVHKYDGILQISSKTEEGWVLVRVKANADGKNYNFRYEWGVMSQ